VGFEGGGTRKRDKKKKAMMCGGGGAKKKKTDYWEKLGGQVGVRTGWKKSQASGEEGRARGRGAVQKRGMVVKGGW